MTTRKIYCLSCQAYFRYPAYAFADLGLLISKNIISPVYI